MFQDLSTMEIWLLIAWAAVIGFYAGRRSAVPSEVRARAKLMAQEEAAQGFARLTPDSQAEVDRLLGEGRTVEAVKLIRAALSTDLYTAKQIVDQRKLFVSPR
jgi:hypothetical protein